MPLNAQSNLICPLSMNETFKFCETYVLGSSARDRSGKPEVRWICVSDGLGTDSPVAPRHAALYFLYL
jgi:hypothetical protein